jgi:hypothetical protein
MSFETYASHRATPRPADQTAHIREDSFCVACGWPVIFAFCSDGMAQISPYAEWDSWIYCANKTCKHHEGEGILYHMPSWIRSSVGLTDSAPGE